METDTRNAPIIEFVADQTTYYMAESLSSYSKPRATARRTPLSLHSACRATPICGSMFLFESKHLWQANTV